MSTDTSKSNVYPLKQEPKIFARHEHNISRRNISENALKVLYKLKNAGFGAYLVGGSVRDMLLGREPKDFDVATDARPEQIRELFRNCVLIGRRFRLAHIRYGQEVVEVSTFRGPHHVTDDNGHSLDGRIIRDNVYGTIDEDVWRRDLSVNALFYNISDNSVIDFVGGMSDIQAGRIRLIGNPVNRYTEDPVRLLRVIRFAVKLGFRIDSETEKSIPELAYLLNDIPPARLFDETLKLFLGGYALQTFEHLRHYDLFASLFPQTEQALSKEEYGFPQMLLIHALNNTDDRLQEDKPVTPGFLIAALLWAPLHLLIEKYMQDGLQEMDAISMASDVVLSRQISRTALPRRFTRITREIWQLQPRMRRRNGKRPYRLLSHPRFRAAYDFLLLRVQAGEDAKELADWWTDFQEKNEHVEYKKHTKKSSDGRRRSKHNRYRKPVSR